MKKKSPTLKILLSLFLLATITACYHEVSEKVVAPKRLLPEDSLVRVLTEIQLADGAITYKRISHKKVGDEKEKYYAVIYKKYNLTPELLKDNINYYNNDPDKMVEIYDKVLARLSQLEAKINLEVKEKEREKARQDSIRAALDTNIFVLKKMGDSVKTDKTKMFIW